MKTFKMIDGFISIILIIFFAISSLVNLNNTFLAGYLIVGAWQVISMITHAINGWFVEKGSKRYKYHWFVTITLVVVLLGFAISPILIYLLFTLVFISPLMAVFYTYMCFSEVRKMNQLQKSTT